MKNKQISTIKTLRLIMPQMFRVTPLFFNLFVLVALLHGLSWGITVTVNQYVFDTVDRVLHNHLSISYIWGAMALLAVIIIISQIVNALHSFVYTPFNRYTIGYFKRKIHHKIGKLSMEAFEDPKILDQINKADAGIDQIFNMAFNFIMLFTFFLPYIIYMAVYLFLIDPKLSFIILMLAIPILISQRLKAKLSVYLEDKSAPHRRAMDYYKQCIINPLYFKETRQLGAFTYFFDFLNSTQQTLIHYKINYNRKKAVNQLITNFIVLFGYIMVLYLLIQTLLDNKMSVGAFTAVFMSLNHLIDTLNDLVGMTGSISDNVGPVNNFLELLAIPDKLSGNSESDFKGNIKFDNVSFTYPGSSSYALHNVSLDIKGGETIALVGENGAGKSTLARLLVGLYMPTHGEVSIDGVKLSDLNLSTAYKGISAVFQKFNKYQMELRENVSISAADKNNNESDIITAIDKAGFSYDSIPNGIDTMLSREFGGIDLSGGQWQRVAMARGFFRDHNLIVLDEPTSAIDPIEETRIYEQFANISKDGTSILITHRLGSAKIADRIFVLDKGNIIESGNHEELMANKGKYFNMFLQQSQWYT